MDCCGHEGHGSGDARFDVKQVADGVHVAVAAPAYKVNSNTAIIESDAGLVIVDTHSKPSAARVIVERLRDLTTKPVRHVVNTHPEWIARLADGRPMSSLTARQRRRLGVEGVFLSPAFPGVRAWLGSIVKEIAMRYAVDGVQLDYIRLPGVQLRGDAGAGPAGPSAGDARRKATAPARVRTPRSETECAHVSAAVEEVRDSLAQVRPGLPLSAAVVADTAVAERANGQRWTSWLREGLIDRAFAMCYAAPLRTVVAQLLSFAASPGMGARVVPGIAVYNTPPATAAAKIKAARALGFPELAVYSYDALASRPGYWPSLRNDLDAQGQSPRGAGLGGVR